MSIDVRITHPDDLALVARHISARRRERYAAAVAGQGLAFTEIRTPPYSLPRDSRGWQVLPPVELFGSDARPGTAQVLAGKGWPCR
jgi:hypothetical protein